MHSRDHVTGHLNIDKQHKPGTMRFCLMTMAKSKVYTTDKSMIEIFYRNTGCAQKFSLAFETSYWMYWSELNFT